MAGKFSSIARMTSGAIEATSLAPEMAAKLEQLGFQRLGAGAHRVAYAHGDRVLKVASKNPLQNIFEAASSLRYPELHPHMARVLGISDTGRLSAMERAYGKAGQRPGIGGMFGLKRRFMDLHSGNFVGGKAVDFGIPRVRYPLEQERQLAQTLGGSQGLRNVFSDVEGFGSWLDEYEGATGQLSVPHVATVGMAGQRSAKAAEIQRAAQRHGLPRLPVPHSKSVPDLPQGRAFGARTRRRGTYSLPS